MKDFLIIDAVSYLDADILAKHLEEKEALRSRSVKQRNIRALRWSTVAAVFCLVLTVGFAAVFSFLKFNDNDPGKIPPESVSSTGQGDRDLSETVPSDEPGDSDQIGSGTDSVDNSGTDTGSGDENAANELYQVLIYDYSDSVSSAKHEIEYVFADYEKYKDAAVDDNIEIRVNGIRYSGKYQAAQYREFNFFPVYQYVSEEGLSFEVDESGVLTSCFWGNASPQGAKKTKEECVAIACDFLANIVDVDSYEIDVVEDPERGMYTVNFIKKIGNFETTDTAAIVVRSDGSLYSYSSIMLGKVTEGSISADSVDLEKVEESVNKKLSSVYQDAEKNYSRIEYSEYNIALTTLKDGNLGVVCTVNVEFIESIAEFETSVSERISFVVLID